MYYRRIVCDVVGEDGTLGNIQNCYPDVCVLFHSSFFSVSLWLTPDETQSVSLHFDESNSNTNFFVNNNVVVGVS